jgi:putative intracellular protease/amidase
MIGLTLAVLPLVACSAPQPIPTPIPPTATPVPTPTPAARRALFVIQEHFNTSEYGEPRAILEGTGATITVAAASLDSVKSYANVKEVQPDILVSNAHAADYDVIVLVGGYPYDPDDPEAHRLAQEAAAGGKLLAGICNGVIAMAKAGVLENKQVTSLTYHPASLLEAGGAVPTDATVKRDGLIISGNGPGASQEFGEAIAAALKE